MFNFSVQRSMEKAGPSDWQWLNVFCRLSESPLAKETLKKNSEDALQMHLERKIFFKIPIHSKYPKIVSFQEKGQHKVLVMETVTVRLGEAIFDVVNPNER